MSAVAVAGAVSVVAVGDAVFVVAVFAVAVADAVSVVAVADAVSVVAVADAVLICYSIQTVAVAVVEVVAVVGVVAVVVVFRSLGDSVQTSTATTTATAPATVAIVEQLKTATATTTATTPATVAIVEQRSLRPALRPSASATVRFRDRHETASYHDAPHGTATARASNLPNLLAHTGRLASLVFQALLRYAQQDSVHSSLARWTRPLAGRALARRVEQSTE